MVQELENGDLQIRVPGTGLTAERRARMFQRFNCPTGPKWESRVVRAASSTRANAAPGPTKAARGPEYWLLVVTPIRASEEDKRALRAKLEKFETS